MREYKQGRCHRPVGGMHLPLKTTFLAAVAGVIRSFLSAPPPPPPLLLPFAASTVAGLIPAPLQPCRFAMNSQGRTSLAQSPTLVATLPVTGDWPLFFFTQKGRNCAMSKMTPGSFTALLLRTSHCLRTGTKHPAALLEKRLHPSRLGNSSKGYMSLLKRQGSIDGKTNRSRA